MKQLHVRDGRRLLFRTAVEPFLDEHQIRYVGSVGPAERDALLGGAAALLRLIQFEEQHSRDGLLTARRGCARGVDLATSDAGEAIAAVAGRAPAAQRRSLAQAR